jgi:hypothetical protein
MLILAACSPTPAPSSPIVQKAQAAGAGDLATASAQSIEDWLSKHRDFAVELDGMCKSARQKADAKWLDTTEGRLCTAAQNSAMHAPNRPKKKSDAQTFEPGWK